jgi:lipid II:glycine glycyltransferase (peptidoglycan interpeptide bridge formation enzyme)
LQKPKEEIWQGMESYCRTHIRKAEKTGFTVRSSTELSDLDVYYDLHCKTYHRTHVKPHPYEYFEMLWKKFAVNGRAMAFFAEFDGKPIAIDVEACFKNALSGWSAAGEGSNTSGVNNLLHWSAIQWAGENKYEWYESGEGFPGETSGKRKGLNDFKKSFGGDLYPIYRGKIIRRRFIYNFRNFVRTLQ